MIKVTLFGGGKMGHCVMDCIEESPDFILTQCIKSRDEPVIPSDVILDFSSPSALKKICLYCEKNFIPAVIATTGYSDEQFAAVADLSKKVAVFYSQNMSVGIAAVYGIIKRLALTLKDYDADIIEKHHRGKADSPSGTALLLARAIADEKGLNITTSAKKRKENELNILSLRAGSIIGEHEVIFNMDNEYISVKHAALSRKVFALGALNAARFILEKPPGLYGINDLY